MKISIITATYNSASTIRDCIESVLSQNYHDVEYIIVDGASQDNTLPILKEYGERITKIISEPDEGMYHAINKGIDIATGDIIGIMNSDDFYIDGNVIREVAALFEKEGSVECTYADLNYVDAQNTSKIIRKWKAGQYSHRSFMYGWMPPHPTFFVRKEVYEKYGLYNPELGTSADYELILRLLERHKCKAAYLPRTIIHMRMGGASNQDILARWKAFKNDRRAWKVNQLSPAFYTILLKPLRKLGQFF